LCAGIFYPEGFRFLKTLRKPNFTSKAKELPLIKAPVLINISMKKAPINGLDLMVSLHLKRSLR
jgi:hypothetical protein